MEALGIIGLLVGIGVLILISYKGLHAVPTSLIAGAVILIFTGSISGQVFQSCGSVVWQRYSPNIICCSWHRRCSLT